MLNTTEDRESDEPTCLPRRLPQFGIRIWNPVDHLRRPNSIVIGDALGDQPLDVIGAEEYEVVEFLLPQRWHETLNVGRRVRRSVCQEITVSGLTTISARYQLAQSFLRTTQKRGSRSRSIPECLSYALPSRTRAASTILSDWGKKACSSA